MRDHGEFPDMFARILDGHGFDFTVRFMVDNKVRASTTDSDGSTGSRHSAYDEFKRIGHLPDYFLTSTLFSDKHLFLRVCAFFWTLHSAVFLFSSAPLDPIGHSGQREPMVRQMRFMSGVVFKGSA